MRELKLTPETQINHEIKQKHEYKLIGSVKNKKGMRLFSFDPSTEKIKMVEIMDRKELDLTSGHTGKKKAVINPNNIHVWAINLKNAERKFNKILNP